MPAEIDLSYNVKSNVGAKLFIVPNTACFRFIDNIYFRVVRMVFVKSLFIA